MRVLFSRTGNGAYLAEEEQMIFCIDNLYYDKDGNEIPFEKNFADDCDDDYEYERDAWSQEWPLA